MARRLIKEEGLLVGGSSGGAVWAALQKAKKLNGNQNCVIILPDSIRNYISKFVDEPNPNDRNPHVYLKDEQLNKTITILKKAVDVLHKEFKLDY